MDLQSLSFLDSRSSGGDRSDQDLDDGASQFEIEAKKMVNVTTDGGVKKKV